MRGTARYEGNARSQDNHPYNAYLCQLRHVYQPTL